MERKCCKCGKIFFGFSWDTNTKCYNCLKLENLEAIQMAIKDGDEDVDTYSSDYVICPYCGHAMEPDLGYADWPEIYEDGSHDTECPECGKTFTLSTSVSYSWETERK